MNTGKVALVTGAARRLGAAIVEELHGAGWNVVIHAHRSLAEAEALAARLNGRRAESAVALSADLLDAERLEPLAAAAQARWGRLDALVNNASTWYPTPLGQLTAAAFADLVGSNLRAPLLLSQACAARMANGGAIVNLLDIHARRPQAGYSAYCAAKAGLWAATEALALELAPRIRVNGVAPGTMLWGEGEPLDAAGQAAVLQRVPLQRLGGADPIAHAVRYLLSDDAAFVTGAVLPVDGGRRLS